MSRLGGAGAARRRPPRGRAYHHGDLRSALLDQVRAIVRERGVGFVSIREVARRARVSHGAPAHHFGSKSGLLTAFAVQGYDRLAATMGAQIAAAGAHTPPDQLAVMGQAYVRFAIECPEHFGIMYPGDALQHRDKEYRRATDSCYGPLIDVIRRGADEGYVDGDVGVVAAAAWALVHGLASLWLSGRIQERTGATDPHAMAEAVTRLFVNSVMRRRIEGAGSRS
jgi:AcrR family transcriptional regulator